MQKFRTLAAFFLVEKQQPQKKKERENNAKYYGHFVRWRTHSARTKMLIFSSLSEWHGFSWAKTFVTLPKDEKSITHLSTVMARMVRTEVWDTVSSMKGTSRHMVLPITQMSCKRRWTRTKLRSCEAIDVWELRIALILYLIKSKKLKLFDLFKKFPCCPSF